MEVLSDYLRRLERQLDCPGYIRRPFLAKTRQMAEDFIQGSPDASPQSAIDYLGEPQDLAREFLGTLDPKILERHQKKKKFLLYGCIALLIAALACVTIWGVRLWQQPVHIEITETLITK